jgi:hypothetical protein
VIGFRDCDERPSRPLQAMAPRRTDLVIARDQIKTLRAERAKPQQRHRLQLGAEIEGPDRAT